MELSRRDLLKRIALGAAGLAALRYLPAVAQSGQESAAPVVEQEPQSGWDSLPIVEGEPAIEGKVIMPQAGVLSIDVGMNSRDKNTTVGTTATQRTAGTYVEVTPGEEDMKDAEGDARYMWTGGNIVLDPVNGVFSDPALREHIYVANNLGNTSLITEADKLPIGLQQLYSVSGEVNPSTSELVASSFINVFDNFGGTEDFSKNVAKAWGVELAENETFTEETAKSPLRAWQLAVSITAAGIEGGDTSELINVGEIAGEKSPISFYRHVNGNTIDVIGRAVNPGSDKNSDIFVITRIENDEETGESVKAVGFTTPEGFAAAYPELAELAPELTAMTGDGIEELMNEVAGLDQTQVFLAELNQFVPKVKTQENERVSYQREGSSYRAITTVTTETGEITRGKVAVQTPEGIDWLADLEFDQFTGDLIDEYSAKYNISREALFEAVSIESFTDKDGNPYLVAVHGDVPLMVVDRNKDGELGWTESTLRYLAEKKGIRVGTTATYFKDSKQQALAEKEFNTWMTENDLTWTKIEPQSGGTLDSRRVSHVRQQLQQANKAGIDFIGHGPFAWSIYPEHASVAGMKDLLKEMFRELPDVKEWNLLRELHPLEWHQDKLLSELTAQLGSEQQARQRLPQLVAEAASTAREELAAEGIELGEIVTSYSDNNNQAVQGKWGVTHQMTKDAAQYFDKAGCHFHAEGDDFPSEQEIIQGLRSLAESTKAGKVMITELDINMRNVAGSAEQRESYQAELYERVFRAVVQSGVCDTVIAFLTLGDKDSWLELENGGAGKRYSPDADPTMFDDNRKRKQSYFRVSSALLNTTT